jgi:hypothetical protein
MKSEGGCREGETPEINERDDEWLIVALAAI